MLNAGHLDAQTAAVIVAPGDDAALDALAARADPAHGFLRASWFRAGGAALQVVLGTRADGTPLAAFPLAKRKLGPFAVNEVAGPYWPFRSLPVACGASDAELAALLADPAARKALGAVWRLGPVFAGDPAADRLARIAPAAGWRVLSRPLGRIYELDIAGSDWPRASTLRKNRWRERRLAEMGALDWAHVTGQDWTGAQRDAIAAIERASWLSGLAGGGDTKFADPQARATWESITADPVLAPMVQASLLTVGGEPAAFTFALELGETRYMIANNYDARFARFGPGKLLLYRDFDLAARRGVRRISWGAGDAGYKSEMGATAGPEIRDLLFVRGKLAAALLARLGDFG